MDKSFILDEGVFNVPPVNTFMSGLVTMEDLEPRMTIAALLDRNDPVSKKRLINMTTKAALQMIDYQHYSA